MAVNIYAALQIDVSVFDEMYGAKDRGRETTARHEPLLLYVVCNEYFDQTLPTFISFRQNDMETSDFTS